MNFRKSLSLITIVIFGFVFCLAIAINGSRAAEVTRTDQSNEGELAVGQSTEDKKDEEGTRTAAWYQSDTATNAFGGVMTQWQFGPDVGYGETGQGYSYTDPLTGAYVSYQSSGMGMGSVRLPVYGGMNSQFGAASYGPWAGGQQYQPQATPGYDTQTSFGGDAFGTQYNYSQGQPNYAAMTGFSLMQNPATAGLGAAMLYGYGTGGTGFGTSFGAPATAFGGFGTAFSPLATGFGSGLTSAYRPTTFTGGLTGGYTGAYRPTTSGYGYPATSGYGYPVTQSAYGAYPGAVSPYGYSTQRAYGVPNAYGSYLY